jgi:tRNA pseudouridine38-40 synthase
MRGRNSFNKSKNLTFTCKMSRYFVEISYKGTAYHGWQKQQNAVSVQETLDRALSTVLGESIETLGCGRTDTGVHASQFFAHFDTDIAISHEPRATSDEELEARSSQLIAEYKLIESVNALIGYDIAVKRFIKVADDAHARFDADSRSYEYHMHLKKDPFLTDYSYHYRWDLDMDRMNEAAKILFEYKDFSCFSKSNTQVKTFLCDIKQAEWKANNDRFIFYISANRFLRNMVRAIVGTLIEVGKGNMDLQGFRDVLDSKNRSEAGVSVPAEGLYLTKVQYPYIDVQI